MKMILLPIAVLIGASAFAQTTSIRVAVLSGNNQPSSQNIANKVAAKIGSTSRYALVKDTSADVVVFVNCVPSRVNGRDVAVACHTNLFYWPVNGVGLSCDIDGTFSIGADSEVTEDLFDSFVQNTSDQELKIARDTFKKNLNAAIAKFPQGVE
jgi:hypothetical protein